MAFNESYIAALSPTATEMHSSSHGLSTSISSLSSSLSAARHSSSSHISKTYRQASTLFLTRRLPEALSTVLPIITPTPSEDAEGSFEPAPVAKASRTTRIKVWSLYLTILNAIVELDPDEGKDAFGTQEWRAICTKVREGEVWEEVVRNGYHGVEGDVDSDVVINRATLLLTHARNQILNQKRLEAYLASANMPNLDISDRFRDGSITPRARFRSPAKGKGAASGADTPRDLNARVKILELYTLHVLLRNNEWDYAREFISISPVLDEERREAFLQALQSLQEEQQEAERHEREERQRQEDKVRREIEEARRLRAENEEREKKRLEEERAQARRESAAKEVDYGVEKPPRRNSNAGSSSSRSKPPANGKQPNGSSSRPLPSTKKGSKAVVAPPSLGTRAFMIISNLKAIVDGMTSSFQANPMLLMRTLAFIMAFLLMFSRKSIREKITRMLGTSWDKIKATAGMGVKISYL
ncbi:hypothetical protein QBC46DRAFT_378571 [Diplogelasinospora grovesii]|uniref:Peroxin 26 n=1 Tax=Diplogelasinospora grovesii TaxID=303347 RepID=A0AAN6NDB3_9PEZI|nr:hypothetical protein QBC46DRAFT_378571 [Diplogelasinospora grovesii]